MTVYVVDTNVAIAANGEADKEGKCPDPECRRECTAKLREVVEAGTVAIDNKFAILAEYRKYLSERSGRPGEPNPAMSSSRASSDPVVGYAAFRFALRRTTLGGLRHFGTAALIDPTGSSSRWPLQRRDRRQCDGQ